MKKPRNHGYMDGVFMDTDKFDVTCLRSNGVCKGVRISKSNYVHPQTKKDYKQQREAIKSCLRDGYNKYFDFAVIGSGVAGLRYALEVAKHGTVAVITKAEPHESNTNYAQGGVSAVLSPSDSVENHVQDTIVAGAHLCDEETVRVCYKTLLLFSTPSFPTALKNTTKSTIVMCLTK